MGQAGSAEAGGAKCGTGAKGDAGACATKKSCGGGTCATKACGSEAPAKRCRGAKKDTQAVPEPSTASTESEVSVSVPSQTSES